MITNKTKNTVLCETHEMADSLLKRARGLMFRDSVPDDHGMLFSFKRTMRPSMWMFGMRFPIDILFLDPGKRVIHIAENARPLGFSWRTWRFYGPPCPASYVLELPSGKTKRTSTSVGDVLEF